MWLPSREPLKVSAHEVGSPVEIEIVGDAEIGLSRFIDKIEATAQDSQGSVIAPSASWSENRVSGSPKNSKPPKNATSPSPTLLETGPQATQSALKRDTIASDEANSQETATPKNSSVPRNSVALDPRSVALGAFVSANCADSGVADDVAAIDSALAAQRLNDHLAAATRPPHLAKREPPRLKRTSDGRYHYSSAAFAATIEPDGFVRFQDAASAELHLSPTVLTFDITDALERAAGNDPYAAEKRWFLEETKEMRRELAQQARLDLMTKAKRHLRGQLLVILRDARSLSEKHQAIFELWDDCAPDEVGTEARTAIEAFVRQEMPQNGPLAFQPAELLAFNSRRYNPDPFQPYSP